MIGVDEAGKGAVLGSMFVAAAAVDGVTVELRDSKRLSASRRTEIARTLRRETEYAVVEVPPDEIDDYVADGSMNRLMVEAHSRALEALGVDGDVMLDASDVSAERFARRVSERVGFDVRAEHGADDGYDCVSAASVLAKVERDAHVDVFGAGSGYPSDPRTVEFLRGYVRRNGELHPEARSSWETSRRILAEESQSEIGDFG